ncbi:MAG TPA: helix-turn-helix transcriptional regulator [Thermoleophilia bacterium]|nr:helix-turn-helix transcriptional regulator [Thermoleophilia bacterium]
MEPRERLAQNIRRRRERIGISQEALGERCELHRTEISLLERAGRDPRLSTLVKVAAALEVSLADLLVDVR